MKEFQYLSLAASFDVYGLLEILETATREASGGPTLARFI